MALQIFNTVSREKETFQPIRSRSVTMYVCGVTVYDYCHIGHARAYVAFDCIRRYLMYKKYVVKYIQNFTDIDDKIIKRANELGEDFGALTRRFADAYFEDMDRLNIMRADYYPKATDHIRGIIQMVARLIETGFAYEIDGDVYFEITKFAGYGKLSGRITEDSEAGLRVEVDERKRNPLDFALWKSSKEGEPYWQSPWGRGRPGWHIECSVMSTKYQDSDSEIVDNVPLIDIHGGGRDLIFPHHENEIAQSEAFYGRPFVKYWMHNGFVNINKEKMSKSLGNVFNLRDLYGRYKPEILRYFLMTTHYRSPINFSDDLLTSSGQAVERLYTAINNNPGDNLDNTVHEEFRRRFEEAMDDDFNTAGAIGVLHDLAKEVNTKNTGGDFIKELGGVLGILQTEQNGDLLTAEIEELIALRNTARQTKDWATADRVRKQLTEMGIQIEDTAQGIRWRRG